MSLIGTIHFIHSPLLVLYPFVISSPYWDLIYIRYFFVIMFAYTYYNGECPFSYTYKKLMDVNYTAGDRINDYDEMYAVYNNRSFINKYLMTTTSLYTGSLLYTMYRVNISPAFTIWSSLIVMIYLSGIKEVYVFRTHKLFIITQVLLRYCFLFALLFVQSYVM
jgi:hypothetical protein